MADNDWKNLELWERVKWARSRRFGSAIAAARVLGMEPGTYRCYERGPGSAKFITLGYKHALPFAREFKVRWEWLLDGLGKPWLTEGDAESDLDDQTEGKPSNHLRAWREYRGLTVAELAKKAGLSVQTIAQLESGAMDVSGKLLRPLADALSTTSGYIIDYDPDDLDPRFVDTMRSIPKERRGQALEILKTFRPYTRII